MIELREIESWDQYLPEFFFSHLGLRISDYEIDAVETGMMNFVFRVRTDKGIFFLKQALSKAKADRAMGPALRTITSHRLEYERNCIAEIKSFPLDGIKIPTVHHYDPANKILLLSDVAGKDGKLLETSLLEGVFDTSTASAVGRFLGVMHRRSWGSKKYIRGSRSKDFKNWERFLDMRTKGTTVVWSDSDISEALHDLYKQTLRHHSHDVLIWMDCCPKNIVVRKDRKIGVFDFELASWVGDPAYDLGFFIGHYLIQAILQNSLTAALQAIAGSIQAYYCEVKDMPFQSGLMKRVLKFAAATIFYRIAGASRFTYLLPESVPQLIKKAKKLLYFGCQGEPDKVIAKIAQALA